MDQLISVPSLALASRGAAGAGGAIRLSASKVMPPVSLDFGGGLVGLEPGVWGEETTGAVTVCK